MNVGSHTWHFSMLEKKHGHLGKESLQKGCLQINESRRGVGKKVRKEREWFPSKKVPQNAIQVYNFSKKRSLSDKQHAHH